MAEALLAHAPSLVVLEDEPEWRVFVDDRVGILARLRLRRTAGPLELSSLVASLHTVLGTTPGIRDVRWHFADPFTREPASGYGRSLQLMRKS